MINKLNKVLIATGGTGGHVFPAYGLAKHFEEKKINVELICDLRGIKYLKKFNDIKITQINTSSIFNKNIIQKLIASLIITYSILKSLIFLIKNKPDLVFGMGGYSSFPVCIAAKFLNIPFIIYENNLYIGKANKFLLPFAIKLFVASRELGGVVKRYEKKISKVGNIAGCMVMNGKIFRNSKIRIIRDGIVVHDGELTSLKRFKDDVKEVAKGYDCGLQIKNYNDIAEGDSIEAYQEVAVKKKLK